ncbi:MAG: D-alanyl-D-alanine carboxypeptidase family protein [Faecousia sp.]
MKTKTYRILTVVLIVQLLVFLSCAAWILYDSRVDRSGWAEKDGVRYYRDFHANPVTGWLDIAGQRYFFLDGGIPATFWLEQNGVTRYLGDDGVMRTGWQTIDGDTYCFDENGIMKTGWQELDGQLCYLPDGILATGWQEIEGKRYYFGDDGGMKTGFTNVNGDIYYLDAEGQPLIGDAVIGENRYCFSDEGVMHTGWLAREDGMQYYLPDGTMATLWQEIGGKRYYFGENGTAATGWYQEGEYSYYFLEDGSAAVGPTEIDGEVHFFTPRGIEVILVNANHPVPDYYERDLVTVADWHQVDHRCYEPLMKMLADCTDTGIEYIFNSGYRTVREQTEILEKRTLEHMAKYELDYEEAREKALETVAIPGTSEHHLGLAVDILGDEAIVWLQEHCWEYGFILRYTAEKEPITGIIDEPWHFRYVGREVSMDMKNSGLCLEEYLGAA